MAGMDDDEALIAIAATCIAIAYRREVIFRCISDVIALVYTKMFVLRENENGYPELMRALFDAIDPSYPLLCTMRHGWQAALQCRQAARHLAQAARRLAQSARSHSL